MSHLEDKFYNDLKSKLASGDLSHEEFKTLIDEHLTKMMNDTATTTHKVDKSKQVSLLVCDIR